MDNHHDPVSRRAVLGGLTAAIATAGCSSSPVGTTANDATASSSAQLAPLATAEMGEWASRVGATFSAGGYGLRLSGIEPLPSEGTRPAELRQRAFIAVFDILGGPTMPGELTYSIAGPGNQRFSIYLTDAATVANPARMYALFN